MHITYLKVGEIEDQVLIASLFLQQANSKIDHRTMIDWHTQKK